MRWFQNKRLVIVVVGFLIVMAVAIVLAVLPSSSAPKSEIKQAIADQTRRSDFDVNDVVMTDGDWSLVKITFTGADNASYNILRTVNGKPQVVLVLGSGSPSVESLVAAGVPDAMIRFLLGDGPHFANFSFLNSVVGVAGTSTVQQLVTSYASLKRLGVFIYNLKVDSYHPEIATSGNRISGITTASFDVSLDQKYTVHIRAIFSGDSGATTYELYDQDNQRIFQVNS